MYRYIAAFLFCLRFLAVFGNDGLHAKVVAVLDGNTVEVLGDDRETYRIVLAGIDSPELTQDYGEKAKQFLESLLMKKKVLVQFLGKDRKGNHLAVVMKGDVDARVQLLKEGLAWTSEKDPLPDLEAHRATAQAKGIGL